MGSLLYDIPSVPDFVPEIGISPWVIAGIAIIVVALVVLLIAKLIKK